MFKIKAHFSGGRETSVLSIFWLIHKTGLSRGTGEQGEMGLEEEPGEKRWRQGGEDQTPGLSVSSVRVRPLPNHLSGR